MLFLFGWNNKGEASDSYLYYAKLIYIRGQRIRHNYALSQSGMWVMRVDKTRFRFAISRIRFLFDVVFFTLD